MNPFESGAYSLFVSKQVEKLTVGVAEMVSVGNHPVSDFRMNLQKIKEGTGMKFKTKVNHNGELWVLRVK